MTLYLEQGIDLTVLRGQLGGALAFTLTETGGGGATGSVSIPDGTHFLTIDGTTVQRPDPDDAPITLGYSPLTTALKTALELIGNATYTVTFNPTTERITIAASGGGVTAFALSGYSDLARRALGFTANKSLALSYAADRAPYYWMKTSEGGLTEYFRDEEEESEIGEDLRSHGADVYGLDQDELPMKFDAVVPLEPRAKLWTEDASATVPWTWQRFFRYSRQMTPTAIAFDNGTVSWTRFVFFTKVGRRFAPRPRQSKNVWTYGDVPITAWEIGRL